VNTVGGATRYFRLLDNRNVSMLLVAVNMCVYAFFVPSCGNQRVWGVSEVLVMTLAPLIRTSYQSGQTVLINHAISPRVFRVYKTPPSLYLLTSNICS
jgi:hypothetical protein